MSGEANHRSRIGPATASTAGLDSRQIDRRSAEASAGAIHIARYEAASPLAEALSDSRLASLEGIPFEQSSALLISSRQVCTQAMASRLKKAS
jgi:hypothetical protein